MIFLHIPAADDSVDPEYQMLTDAMVETGISIQDCRSYGGKFSVIEYAPKGTPAPDFWMMEVGEGRNLKQAKDLAEIYFTKRTANA